MPTREGIRSAAGNEFSASPLKVFAMYLDSYRLCYASADSTAVLRGDLRACLARWQMEDLADDATVVASELLSTALRHGRPPVHVECALRRRFRRRPMLRVKVIDHGPSFDSKVQRARWRHPSFTLEESGRGLYLVDALSSRWGERPTPEGHVVWADLFVSDGTTR
ncbi:MULTISPECIES: ATP-binding protein [unclassified Streptomyces]|uniref:ATP-binding protein n=1 Tax=unclassified Streptomyces TaxID=2593676 RepID=UPI00380DF96D